MQTQCGLDFWWGKWSSNMTRYSSTLFYATSCPWENFLLPAGTSWESAKIIQTRLGGVDIWQNAENTQIFRQRWGNRSHRCFVTLELHTKFWPKKIMEMFCRKTWLLSYWYMQGKGEGIILKTNKQTSKQIPVWNYIISLPDPKFFTAMGILPFPWMMTEIFLQTALWIKWMTSD